MRRDVISNFAYNISMLQIIEEKKIVLHQGVYKPAASVADAVFMITGMTIGAGVLGIPYVVAQVGLRPGLLYILVFGIVMFALNLMLGDIAVRTKEKLQIPGLAGKYLGNWAKQVLNVIIIFSSFAVLLAYVVGESEILHSLFGGEKLFWGIFFWSIGSVVVWRGLGMAKTVEKILSLTVMTIIVGLSFGLLTKFQAQNWFYLDSSKILLPFGVILFALNGTSGVIEAHALLPGSQRHFKKALIIGTLIPMAIYALFALAVVGTSGLDTTSLATIGLGSKFGSAVLLMGNIFAILAMTTGFIGAGIALKQTFVWDNKVNKYLAEFFVIFVPLALFLLGLRNFVAILNITGGVFFGIQALIMIVVCYRARKVGELPAPRYGLNHFWLMAIPVFLVFALVTVLSAVGLIK